MGGPDTVGMEPLYVESLIFFCLGSWLLIVILLAAWFRLFVGDLSNDVSDDVLANAFNKYISFQKARVIRDRLSGKVRSEYFRHCSKTGCICRRNMGSLHFQTRKIF